MGEYILTFDNFPISFIPVHLRQNAIVYRYSSKLTDPKDVQLPRFFSSYDIALLYSKSFGGEGAPHNIFACRLNKLKLLDVRIMKFMILEGLQDLTETQLALPVITVGTTQYTLQQVLNIFMKAYGLIPDPPPNALQEPFQNYGYRHSVVNEDDIAVTFMKMIFYPEFDGYVGPRLWLADQKTFTEELCLFEPSSAINTTIKLERKTELPYKTVNLKDIMSNSSYYKNDATLVGVCLTGTGASTQEGSSSRKRHVGGHACAPPRRKLTTLPRTNISSTPSKIEPDFLQKLSDSDLPKIEQNISDLELQNIKGKVHAQFIYDAYINEID